MNKKNLIVYFSESLDTEKVAKMIQANTGGDLYRILPQEPYPSDYDSLLEESREEIINGRKRELVDFPENLENYETIFIGSPNWWNSVAPPVAEFISSEKIIGKTILPFVTHGGAGKGNIREHLEDLCPSCFISEPLSVHGSGGSYTYHQMDQWLKENAL